ncbi:MAG: flagellar biosynthesis protein FliQ [Acidimicrobiia bacterium]|nr:flagellar biosynthesis protein FliQ [Acidimicrobiia bacterium]MDH4365448.1 flagellar biosynthesis protein FliQ [Acidimicrobiia bacterium]
MTETTVIEIVTSAMWTATKVSAPILVTAIVVGVVMGLLQSVTQIQEQTLAFVPKFAAVALVIMISGQWMLHLLVDFTTELIGRIPSML